ncbi:MAG: carbohydrate ABC transporter permease [Caldilineaceae bacterium]|nr:carbohydrate ABC transporter permease [Caldilineaceae bacterium]
MANKTLSANTVTVAPTTAAQAHAQRGRGVPRRLVGHLVLILLSALFTIPFYWLLSTSLKPPEQLFRLPPEWIPNPVMWSNYAKATTFIPFFRYFGNTLYITIFNVFAILVSCSLVAYGFARIQWPGRDGLFMVLISTLMIPSAVTLIPTFIIFRNLGWVGTPNPLTWPAFTGNAFYIFLLRQFFLTIPSELSAAAKIDGASEFQIYWRIILPLARAALAAVALFTFMANWNDFIGPLIYLSDKDQFTLAIGLYGFLSRVRTEWGPLMAASTIMIAPVIVLFFFTQRTFIQGITMTGIK